MRAAPPRRRACLLSPTRSRLIAPTRSLAQVGALTLGTYNSSTIRGGIINTTPFAKNGGAFMLCMLCTVMSSSTFNFLSNRFGWATSSTHAIIGALVGVGIASQAGVNWSWTVATNAAGTVTGQSGLASVVASFFISPLLAGIIGAIIFGIVKFVVLRRGGETSFLWAMRSAPFWYALVAAFEAWLITWKSPRLPTVTDTDTIIIFFATFGIVGLLVTVFICPYLYRSIWKGWAGLQLYHLPLMPLTDAMIEKLAPGIQRREVWFDDRHLHGIPVPVEETWYWGEDDQIAIARKRGIMPPRKVIKFVKNTKTGEQKLVDVEAGEAAAAQKAINLAAGLTEDHQHLKPVVSGVADGATIVDASGVSDGAVAGPPGISRAATIGMIADGGRALSGKMITSSLRPGAEASAVHPGYMPIPKRVSEAVVLVDEEGKPLSGWKTRKAEYADVMKKSNFLQKIWHFTVFWLFIGVDREIADWHLEEDTQITYQHDSDVAERYYGKTEAVFRALQVLTSSLASFSHGANDVALSVGPLSALYYYWYNGGLASFPKSTSVLDWQLAVGALSLVLGLWFYGYSACKDEEEGRPDGAQAAKPSAPLRPRRRHRCVAPSLPSADMMRVLGNRLCFHSPSRGFSMEMGAAITVLIAARNGIPVSTTNCIVGATMGVGLMNSKLHAVNWKLFVWTFFLWCITLPFCGIISGALYGLIAYSPMQNCNGNTLYYTVPQTLKDAAGNVIPPTAVIAYKVSNPTNITALYPLGCIQTMAANS